MLQAAHPRQQAILRRSSTKIIFERQADVRPEKKPQPPDWRTLEDARRSGEQSAQQAHTMDARAVTLDGASPSPLGRRRRDDDSVDTELRQRQEDDVDGTRERRV